MISLLLATCVSSVIYYVNPNDSPSAANDTFVLQHYISNAGEYLVSNNELHFLPGLHDLNTTFILKNVSNLTFSGMDRSTIRCDTDTSLVIANMTNFIMSNIHFINCGRHHTEYVESKRFPYVRDPMVYIKTAGYGSSVFIYRCQSIKINNVTITPNAGFAGLIAVDVTNISLFTDIKVQVNCSALQMNYNHLLPINGMVFLYKWSYFNYKPNVKINISNYQYKSFGSCSHFSHYAVTILLRQCYTTYFNIYNVTLNNLNNSSVLYYYHKKCMHVVKNALFIKNLKIYNNVGNSQLKMFYINLADAGTKDNIFKNSYRHQSSIIFRNCHFINNTNFEAIIFIVPAKAEKAPDYIEVGQGKFYNNTNVHFIKVKSATEILWKLPTYIKVKKFTIASNRYQNGDSLISIVNGILVIEGSTFFAENSLYQNIIKLHFSMVVCKGHIEFTDNTVRFITSGNSGSFFLVMEYTTLVMSSNTVYMVARYARTFGENTQVICPIQFYSKKDNLDQNPLAFNCTILLQDNVFMVSKYLPVS